MKTARILNHRAAMPALALAIALVVVASGCVVMRASPQGGAQASSADLIREGERLVHNMDCNVCHTPKIFTAEGPKWDTSRLLSGHPSDEKLPPIPAELFGPQGWGSVCNNGLTAWAGPWGVSFGSNLTPDEDTGAGLWTEQMFVESMRTGTHVENPSRFLPPMPTYSRLTDGELRAIFHYLKSIKPVRNEVPAPLPPPPVAANAKQSS